MIDEHRETAKLSVAGVLAVILTGLTVTFLVPETEIGKIIRFTAPLLVGMIFGAKIYLRELKKFKRKVDEQEED
jgi:hypothetical protein